MPLEAADQLAYVGGVAVNPHDVDGADEWRVHCARADKRHVDAVLGEVEPQYFGDTAQAELRGAVRSMPREAEQPRRGGDVHELSAAPRSEEHTSELQSRGHLVCRL